MIPADPWGVVQPSRGRSLSLVSLACWAPVCQLPAVELHELGCWWGSSTCVLSRGNTCLREGGRSRKEVCGGIEGCEESGR